MGVKEDNQGGRFLEARSKRCRDLDEKKGHDTMMIVRPKSQPSREGLSHDGETAEDGEHDMEEEVVQEEEGREENESVDEDEEAEDESRKAVGKMSPKEPTKKQREEHELTHMP